MTLSFHLLNWEDGTHDRVAIKIRQLLDSCSVLKHDGCDHLQQPLMLACVFIHFDVFWRPLVVSGAVVLDGASGLTVDGDSQPDMCTKVLSNWVWGGEMLGSGRYWKEGIKSSTKSTFQNWVKESAGIYGKKVGKGLGCEMNIFLPNWTSQFLGQLSQNFPLNGEISFEGLTLQNTKSWPMFPPPLFHPLI